MAFTDQNVADFIHAQFPADSFVLGVPELVNLFRGFMDPTDASKSVVSSDQALAQLQNTSWWKAHGQAQRAYVGLQQTDPETLAENIRQKDAEVHQMANQMGLADNQVNIDQMARNAIQFGWGNNELQEQLAGQAQYSSAAPGTSNLGTIDNTISQLKQTAAQYMVPLDDQTAFTWARDVAAGHHQVADYTPMLAQQAKGRFPSLADYIDKGITPQQFVQPLQNQTASLLEKSPDSIDMTSPTYSKMLDYVDPKTSTPRPMTLTEAGNYTRGLDDWKNTAQAQQSVASTVEGILKQFGKVG